jgi:hypothetical protein
MEPAAFVISRNGALAFLYTDHFAEGLGGRVGESGGNWKEAEI